MLHELRTLVKQDEYGTRINLVLEENNGRFYVNYTMILC